MPELASIHQRMVAILGELPAIGKDQRNQQQNYAFRGIDDAINALKPLLAKHGVYYLPDAMEMRESERVTRSGTVMYVVRLHVRFLFYGLAGDCVTASAWGEGSDSGDKATSKAHTMAQKSALVEAFNISTEDTQDPDAQTPEESEASPPRGRAGEPTGTPHSRSGTAAAAEREAATQPAATLAEAFAALNSEIEILSQGNAAERDALTKRVNDWVRRKWGVLEAKHLKDPERVRETLAVVKSSMGIQMPRAK